MTGTEISMIALDLIIGIDNKLGDDAKEWCYNEGLRNGITMFLDKLLSEILKKEDNNEMS